ncbi:hypothetical protein Poly59_17750 [Rubripirellula reticaptiva]|uniref:Uncharacterized protein n=1 Tax=Rubripirellula reticaptiva TaxID=2528013 RepID=A0A5C6F5X4_9BACT|nr:hypothetical protein Poly59_17750 [Rubripirellula reticaptiva]
MEDEDAKRAGTSTPLLILISKHRHENRLLTKLFKLPKSISSQPESRSLHAP